MMAETPTRLVIASETSHVALILPYVQKGATVLALDREVEYLLEEQGIDYLSVKNLRGAEPHERIVFAQITVRNLFSSEAWNFFSYRNIPLGKVFTFVLQEYLDFFLYYVEIYAALANRYPEASWTVLPPHSPPPRSGGALAFAMHRVVQDAARLVASQKGIDCELVDPQYTRVQQTARTQGFALSRRALAALLSVAVTLASLGVKKKKIRILASEYWFNISRIVDGLPEAQICMLERSEARNIPFYLLRSRMMRFASLASYVGRGRKRIAQEAAARFSQAFQTTDLKPCIYHGIDLAPALHKALSLIIKEGVPDALLQIEGAYNALENVDVTLLRTSVSGQTHYSVLALVALELGVPSLEVQHGLEYLGPGSLSSEHAARYIATYGRAIQTELEMLGYDSDRLIAIGSPRFDVYSGNEYRADGPIICIGPDIYPGGGFDTYDAEEYVAGFLSAAPEDVQLLIKLRGHLRESFFQKVIARHSGTHQLNVEMDRALPEVFQDGARLVVCCYSTALLESLQCGIPSMLFFIGAFDKKTSLKHFAPYVDAGVIDAPEAVQELRTAIARFSDSKHYESWIARTRTFMSEAFSFDGKATERMLEVVRRLATQKDR